MIPATFGTMPKVLRNLSSGARDPSGAPPIVWTSNRHICGSLSSIELDIPHLVGQDLAMPPKTTQIPPQAPRHIGKAPRQIESAPRRVEVLAFPDVQMLDVAGPIQVFTAANERVVRP